MFLTCYANLLVEFYKFLSAHHNYINRKYTSHNSMFNWWKESVPVYQFQTGWLLMVAVTPAE
jgi:hypothetical protein